MDMDSDSDSSVTSKSTTSSSECPSVPDEERLEPALILGATVELPQDLCEHPATFNEFFSLNTWNCLSEANKQHLRNFLPSFPDNDEEEKEISLRMLFAREPFKFSSPLVDFQRNLHEGNYRPDIAKMRDIFKKTRRKEQRFEERERCSRLMKDVLLSRHKLLDLAFNSPPGAPLKAERSPQSISKPVPTPSALRAKKRYFQELANIGTEVGTAGIISEDENYPEGPPAQMSRKQRRHLSGIQGGAASPGAEMRVQSTLCHRDSTLDYLVGPGGSAPLNEESYRAVLVGHKKRRMEEDDHPELETGGITLSDISVRTQLASGHRRPIPTRPSSRQAQNTDPKPKKSSKAIKTEPVPKSITPIQKTFTDMSDIKPSSNALRGTVMNSQFSSMLQQHGYSTNTDSENDSVVDPVEPPVKAVKKVKTVTKRAQSAASQKPTKSAKANKQNSDINALGLKAPIVHSKGENFTISHDSSPIIPQKAIETEKSIKHSHFSNATVATYSDLEGIDMMHLPVDLDDSNIDILDEMNNKTPELMQETHACFLSLIRDIIYSTTDHRMHMDSLEKHLVAWQDNPISPLNDWYNLVENWLDHLPSAINFLTGDFTDQPEDFVPYLEYKPMLQMYQWIGAGRDTDNLIVPLCHYWFDHKSNMAASQSQPAADTDAGLAEQHQTPPLPRWPTTWKVRKVEDDEIQQFREQERIRYEAPHKAFTYRMHGFESVVAPIKGIYNQAQGISKARGHLMLNANRPNFVTILTLVRDATARLPNGEGTRADIVELLRCSQYISTEALDSELQSVVSGALDRMHTEYDPCVKYDPKRKIWIYLHRNRTESEFERVHQQIQAMGKLKRNNRKPSKPKAIKSAKAPKSAAVETTPVVSDPELALDVKEELEINVETDPVPPLKVAVGEKKKTVKASVPDKPVKVPKPSPVHVEVPVSKVQESLPLPAKPILPVKVPNNTFVSGKAHTSVLANQGTRAQSPVVPKKNIVQNVEPVKMSNLAVQKSTEPNLNDSVNAVISTAPNVQNITVQRQVMANASMSPKTIKPIISMPSVVASTKPGKSLVKITPGKSLINPAVIANAVQSQQVFIKQQKSATVGEQILKPLVSQSNVVQQQVTTQNVIAKPKLIQTLQNQQSKQVTTLTPAQKQQLLQSLLAQQQKQQLLQSLAQQKVQTTSVPVPQIKSQQLIQNISQQHAQHTTTSHVQQTFTPQQILQSIANTQQKIQISTAQTVLPIQTTTALSPQQVFHTLAQQSHKTGIIQATSSGQTTTLTHAQQQQLLQSLKQQQLKNQQQSMAGAQFQLKQHAVLQQLQKQIQQNSGNLTKTGTSLLGTNMQRTSVAGATQTPLVAKVLTNASGQVISVESLLNKQGIQQGVPTTLRVGPKPGQSNMIQLSSGSPNQVSQYAVVSQGNIIQVSSSRVMSAHTSTPTLQTTPISAQRIMRPVVATKPNQKLVQQQLTQQIVNAKLLQGKIIASQPNKSGIVMANLKNAAGGNTLRMVNTSGLNIAHIGGKPIILASKGSQLQGQNVILQGSQSEHSTSVMIGGQALKVPNNLLTQGNVNLINANLNQNSNSQTVMLGGQMIKVQSGQSGVSLTHASSSMNMGNQGLKTVTGTNSVALNQQSVVLGQALKVQSGTTVKTQGQQGQRVVLASQGQGGQLVTQQILLPPGFQGGSINIKTLQGLKVIPIAQQGKGGLAGRQQVFARLISPPSPRPPLQGD